MGLTDKKEEQIRKMPIVETRIFKSKDSKYLIHKTMITDIKPLEYYKVVFENDPLSEDASENEAEVA